MKGVASWALPYIVFAALALTVGLWAAWWFSLGALLTLLFAAHEIGRRRLEERSTNGKTAVRKVKTRRSRL